MVDRRMAGSDGVAVPKRFRDVDLRSLDRIERLQTKREVGRDRRGKGAPGAMGIPGVDSLAFKEVELLAVKDQIRRGSFAVPTLDDHDLRALGVNTAGGLPH